MLDWYVETGEIVGRSDDSFSETVAFHTGVTLMSALAFKVEDLWRDYIRPREGKVPLSGVRAEFK